MVSGIFKNITVDGLLRIRITDPVYIAWRFTCPVCNEKHSYIPRDKKWKDVETIMVTRRVGRRRILMYESGKRKDGLRKNDITVSFEAPRCEVMVWVLRCEQAIAAFKADDLIQQKK